MATKRELELEIKRLEKEAMNTHDLLEKHDLLPKEPTLQDVIMQLESDGMIAIQNIADTVTTKTGRPFISINSRVVDFIPTIAMVDDPFIVMVKESDSLKDMLNIMIEYRFNHPEKYSDMHKAKFIDWVTNYIDAVWGNHC